MKIGTRNNAGMALAAAIVLAGAAAVTAAVLVVASMTKMRGANRSHSFEQAFFIAEAGVQRAKAQIQADAGFGPTKLGPDGLPGTADDGIFAFGDSVDFAGGSFAVHALPTVSPPPGIVVNPSNVIVVVSTGLYNNATRVIEAALLYEPPIPLPPPGSMDAALAYYGTNAYIKLLGAPIKVDGRDYDVPVDFYATGNASEGTVNQFKPPTPSSLYGATPVTIDGALPAIYEGVPPNPPRRTQFGGGIYNNSYWTNFAALLTPLADNVLTASVVMAGDMSLGTRDQPLITVVKSGVSLHCSGNAQGAGILIVEKGADFRMTGNFRFEGLVIAEGNGFSTLLGFGNPVLLGATIAMGHNARATVGGTPKIAFSSQALANLVNLRQVRPRVSFVWWREIK